MDRFEVNASWNVFHCYNGGELEDTKGFIDINEPKDGCVQSVFDDDIKVKVVEEETLDLTGFEEVRIIQKNDDDTMWLFNDEKELDDDHEFPLRLTHVILPNKESWDMYEVIDDELDPDSFECSSGDSFIDYYSVTADGIESIDEEDLTDDDYDDSF